MYRRHDLDFDRLVDRRRTDSYKWQKFGPDVLPLWVADMDFQSPGRCPRAARRVEHGFFGYLAFEQPEFQSCSRTGSSSATAGASHPPPWC